MNKEILIEKIKYLASMPHSSLVEHCIYLEDENAKYKYIVDFNSENGIICEKNKKYDELQSNWNSLRELIKWRPIEEYDENKYDWVLVKYYDGDYECVPTVAERRKGTNKWYDTNNNEIIFEVKYFFDMQLLDKMNELEGKSDDN